MIVAAQMKAKLAAGGMRSSGDLTAALTAKAEELLEAAAARAKKNGRQTVQPHDL